MAGNRRALKSETADILICGAGVPGMALALLLAGAGLSVLLVDRNTLPKDAGKTDGRTSALMQGSINILKAAGGWEAAAPSGEKMRTLRIVDDSREKPASADFQAREIGLEAFGVNMPNGTLAAALAAQVRKTPSIRVIAPATIDRLDADPFAITAHGGGARFKARLLVGADGRHSAVRDLAGIRVKTHDYGQSAITCVISHSLPHRHTSTEFHRPSGPFTLVPLPGQRSSVVWVDHTVQAETFMNLKRQDFQQALSDRTKGILGDIKLDSAPSCFPLIGLSAETLTAPRTILIAEAAHVLHPLGAQGLNLSLRDAGMLAETLADAVRAGQDPGVQSVLKTYESRRRYDMMSRTVGIHGLNRLVSTDLSFVKSVRQAALRIVGGVPPLKKLAMTQGLAPALDESRLARGESL